MTANFELTKKVDTREFIANIIVADNHYTLTMTDNGVCFHQEARSFETLAETMQSLFESDYRL